MMLYNKAITTVGHLTNDPRWRSFRHFLSPGPAFTFFSYLFGRLYNKYSWLLIMGIALSRYRRVHIRMSNIPTIDKLLNQLVEIMSGSPIQLSQRLIEWTSTSTDNTPTSSNSPSLISSTFLKIPEKSLLLPYMSFIRSSEWYQQLLKVAISSLTSKLPSRQMLDVRLRLSPPSRGYHCNCEDCKNLHSFLQADDGRYTFQEVKARRDHVVEVLTSEYGLTCQPFGECSRFKWETLPTRPAHTLIVQKHG
jgi:hypothetical protein